MGKKEKESDLLKLIGGPQVCPKCGNYNSSGKKLPDECMWCKINKKKK